MALDISKIQFPDQMTIREACLFLDLGEQRVRALHRAGQLKGSDSTGRLLFAKKDLEAFKTEPRTRSNRETAAGKAFVIRVTADKLPAVQKFLEGQSIKLEQRYDYEKMKTYQAKSKARKAATKGQSPEAISTAEHGVIPVTTQTPVAEVKTAAANKGGLSSLLSPKK